MTAAPLVGDNLVPATVSTCQRPPLTPADHALRCRSEDVTRVLVVGGGDMRRPGRVAWALTQVWRRAGRPLVVVHGLGRDAGRWACRWVGDHEVHGVRCEPALNGSVFDVLVAFQPTPAAMTTALAFARRVGVEVVDGDRIDEFRGVRERT